MRGALLHKNRIIRIIIYSVLAISAACVWQRWPYWTKDIIEHKIKDFTGSFLSVHIDKTSAGIFSNIILHGVEFYPARSSGGQTFRFKKVEFSYSLFDIFLERYTKFYFQNEFLENVRLFLSDNNPFMRGEISIQKFPDRVEIAGEVTPILFEDNTKRVVRGTFNKLAEGNYDCNAIFDSKLLMTGTIDLSGYSVDVRFRPLEDKKSSVTLKVDLEKDRTVQVYSRVDRGKVFGKEIVADVWAEWVTIESPEFSIKIENILVDKKPVWDFKAEGVFSPEEKKIYLNEVMLGDAFSIKGAIGIGRHYPLNIKLNIDKLDIGEFATMLGDLTGNFMGIAEGDIVLSGPAPSAEVDGRLYIGKGKMGEMEFKSVFATLDGKLPQIKIVDSRVIKDGGNLKISGDIDFTRFSNDKAFEDVIFETDNKVAVWEDWQISKGAEENVVQPKKDSFTLSTTISEDITEEDLYSDKSPDAEVKFQYSLDLTDNVQLEVDEENDFFGLEHKVEF